VNAILAPRHPEPKLPPIAVSEAEMARLIGVSPRTAWTMRRDGTGPRPFMARGSVRYLVSEIHRWCAEQTEGGAS
jgi:predicted DNA-binding transcriptional regulator AlpA